MCFIASVRNRPLFSTFLEESRRAFDWSSQKMHDKSLKLGLSANSAVHRCHSLRIRVALPLQHPSTYTNLE